MTIEELEPAPQDANPIHENDLESLVRALSEQAKAADQRSAELADRIALLEIPPEKTAFETDDTSRPLPNGRRGSTRVSFAQMKEESTQDISVSTRSLQQSESNGRLRSVVGVPEDDVEEALTDRVLLIERRLEDYEEEKGIFDENKYSLPESTFSLLVTHHPLSVPFAFGVFSMALSISCLSLTLASAISNGVNGNRLGIPAGVDGTVRAAQFLGAIVGVLMEDEIPQGLQLIANGAGHTLLLNGKKPVHKRVIVSSTFRLIVGYLFLSSLFINIAQNADVIEIFYDVLALEFVENIDDTSFALAKRGFFGRSMLIATNQKYTLQQSGRRGSVLFRDENTRSPTRSMTERRLSFSGLIASNNRVNHIVRLIYFLNAAIILGGLGYIAATQKSGHYRCNTINVLFEEEIWEHAHVRLPDGSTEERLLIYSYFNGIYKEDGYHDGYPKYIEQNKNDGTSFGLSVKGAEIIYCNEIGSWVFTHPDISTSPNGEEENECSWLWRSPQTQDHNILSVSDSAWEAWIGEVKPFAQVSITCNECSERSDCNYHGSCEEKVCNCHDSYFGGSCEFETPCQSLATEKAQRFDPVKGMQWKQDNPIREVVGHRVYNRPVYIQKGLSGEPYDMRLYNILEKEISPSPSSTPSNFPSVSNVPTPFPTRWPTFSPTTPSPSNMPSDTPSTWTGNGAIAFPTSMKNTPPPSAISRGDDEDDLGPPILGLTGEESDGESHPYDPTTFPTGPRHSQNEYDTAPDFADWDDFFESKALHNLEDILEDYSVIISYSGSRFYGTIIEPDLEIDDIFPQDYHAFWSETFDEDRTFIISDTTFASSPAGTDFFEMRRRINNSMFSQNVQFSYGPFGALIPLMSYEGTGFFHCIDETPQPSASPSSSGVPTSIPSNSISPTDGCIPVEVNIFNGDFGNGINWSIYIEGGMRGGILPIESSQRYFEPSTRDSYRVCLYEGVYEFTTTMRGRDELARYSLASNGEDIADGNIFPWPILTKFSIPVSPKPSAYPTSSTVPTVTSPPSYVLRRPFSSSSP